MGPNNFYGSIAVNADQANTNVRGDSWKMEEWSFVAITYDGKTLILYVDGETVNSKEVGKADTKEGEIWLATWKSPGWDFTGVLDEAGVFNTPLSDDHLKAIMDNGLEAVSSVCSRDKMAITWGYTKNTR